MQQGEIWRKEGKEEKQTLLKTACRCHKQRNETILLYTTTCALKRGGKEENEEGLRRRRNRDFYCMWYLKVIKLKGGGSRGCFCIRGRLPLNKAGGRQQHTEKLGFWDSQFPPPLTHTHPYRQRDKFICMGRRRRRENRFLRGSIFEPSLFLLKWFVRKEAIERDMREESIHVETNPLQYKTRREKTILAKEEFTWFLVHFDPPKKALFSREESKKEIDLAEREKEFL